jgi:hypothetical protein
VNIIPHGFLTEPQIRMSLSRIAKILLRTLNPVNLFFPKLKLYWPKGDIFGSSDQRVRRVYCFPGLPFGAKEKQVEISALVDTSENLKSDRDPSANIAVVLGQPLFHSHFVTAEALDQITAKIRNFLSKLDFEKIYYAPHPKAKGHLDMFASEYELLSDSRPIELYIMEKRPKLIVSCCSMALAMGKLIGGNDIDAVSIGINLLKIEGKEELAQRFTRLGVKVL